MAVRMAGKKGTNPSDITKAERMSLGIQLHMDGEDGCNESQVTGHLGRRNINAMRAGSLFCSLLSCLHPQQCLAPRSCSLHV